MLARADTIVIELAGPPKGKGRPRFARATGHAYTPAETRHYESHLRLAAQRAMAGRLPAEGPVTVDVVATMPSPASWSRKKQEQAANGEIYPLSTPDADNLLKMLDGFNEIVWRDDKQIVAALVRKRYGRAPSFRVTVQVGV
jgi:Holliday junction resolvase RusA-like endonuclease